MKEIQLTQNKIILIDDEDYELINQYHWCLRSRKNSNNFYAQTQIWSKNKRNTLSMHKLIMRLEPGDIRQIDHIDGNGLNNQKYNLRIVTHQQNMRNKRKSRNSISKYKGVCWNKRTKKWMAAICIGSFVDQQAAAKAYDDIAKYCFGEYAFLNFPEIKNA